MKAPLRYSLFLLCVAVIAGCAAYALRHSHNESKSVVSAEAASTSAQSAKPTGRKSALDKATLESYVRHLFVWGPQIKVLVMDPKPSARLPGFSEVSVIASAGGAVQEELFYVSKDGNKILRAMVLDVSENPFKEDLDKLKTEGNPSFGTPGAPVVIAVFSDFQCAYCAEEAKVLRQNLLSAYPKEVRVYFKDFPLEQIHPWARSAAVAGRCIFRQNPAAFWDYHDWAFANQQAITPENFKTKLDEFAKGKEKEIDLLQLSRCVNTGATEAEVDRNAAEARALQINSTPTMFVNGRRLVGQVAWPNLKQIIDFEIEYQKTAKNAGEEACCEISLPSPLPK